MSRIGKEARREESRSWRNERFKLAFVVEACTAYRGAPAFDSEIAPVKELKGMVMIVQQQECGGLTRSWW